MSRRATFRGPLVGWLIATAGFAAEPAPGKEAAEREAQQAAERAHQEELAKMQADREKLQASPAPLPTVFAPNPRYARLLAEAEASVAEGRFKGAEAILGRLQKMRPAGTPTPARENQLQAAIAAGLAPVEVTLKSDGNTYVSISPEMHPERFRTKTITLRPGSYIVKGTRRGFPDETVQLDIGHEDPHPTATIVCH